MVSRSNFDEMLKKAKSNKIEDDKQERCILLAQKIFKGTKKSKIDREKIDYCHDLK